MASKEDDAPLKVIDFGLSAQFAPGQKMTTKAGTPYYVAPEVLRGSYTEKCDIWSAGVMAFILMSGYPPFYGEKDSEILAKVRQKLYSTKKRSTKLNCYVRSKQTSLEKKFFEHLLSKIWR